MLGKREREQELRITFEVQQEVYKYLGGTEVLICS